MTTQEITMLVKQHLARTVRDPVQILEVVPKKDRGWGVFIKYDGLVWKQTVHIGGELGDLKLQLPSIYRKNCPRSFIVSRSYWATKSNTDLKT